MDEVDTELKNRDLINNDVLIVVVSMGGLIGFNMLKRNRELERIWHKVNIYSPLGSVHNKQIPIILPMRDRMINPEDVAKEL